MAGTREIRCASWRHPPARDGGALHVLYLGQPPFRVDILTRISGVAFDDAWSRRETYAVNEATGLTAPVISAADLIVNKLASGQEPERLQDLADVQPSGMQSRPAEPRSMKLPDRTSRRRRKGAGGCPNPREHKPLRSRNSRFVQHASKQPMTGITCCFDRLALDLTAEPC